jgi:Tfp pilus assembly protein PilO
MSMKRRLVAVAVAVGVVTVAWAGLLWLPSRGRVADLGKQREEAKVQRAALEQSLRRLNKLKADEPALRSELSKLEVALPGDPKLPDFLLQVQQAANSAGITFLSVAPALPQAPTPPPAAAAPAQAAAPAAPAAAAPAAPTSPVLTIPFTVAATGKFAAVESFVKKLEQLPRTVRISSFTVAPGGSAPVGSPVSGAAAQPAAGQMTITFQAQMFVAKALQPVSVPAPAA